MSDAAGASGGGLVRSSGVVAVGTLLSRVTGLLRTILLAAILGQRGAANVYNLANSTPNLVYDLLLGGILSATLVPVLVANRERDDDDSTDAILTVATTALVVITVVTFVLAPAIIGLYAGIANAGGRDPSGAEEQLATELLRFFAPQILFYGLTTLATALLNAHRRFAAAAFAPVLNNVMMFAVLIVAWRMIDGELSVADLSGDTALLVLLGLGTTAGIVAMALVLWPAIGKAGIRIRWRFDLGDAGVRRVGRLSGWTLGYVITNQVAIFAITALAFGIGQAEVSGWAYAYQFFQLPYGVFTVSVMTAFMPELASMAARGDGTGFNDRLLQGLRLVFLVVLPASVLFWMLARPIVGVFLEHGSFSAADAEITSAGIVGFAVGMVGFSAYLFVMRGFYALQDTKTPFLVNLFENGVNLVLAVVFVRVGWGLGGLALAWSLAYLVAAGVAWHQLHRRIGPLGRPAVRTTRALARMGVGAVAMAVTVGLVLRVLPSVEQGGSFVLLLVGGLLGGGVYLGVLVAFRVPEVREIPRLLRR